MEIDSLSNQENVTKIREFLWSDPSLGFIPSPSLRLEICMNDSTHCKLLYSPLSSSAFLNMHALHFSTTFQTQMDVLLLCLYSLLPSLSSFLCSLKLRCICVWPNFQVWSILQFGGRLWSSRLTDRHKRHTNMLASMPQLCPLLCPPTPLFFARMNPSLSAFLCQTQLRFFVFMAPDTRNTHTQTPPAPLQNHLLFGLKRENRRLIHCLTDMP